MVTLDEVSLDRTKGTGLNFGIRDRHSWKGYFIEKYHIFDPKNGNIIISDITHLSEKNNKEMDRLELGSECQSLGFMTGIPACSLIRKRKPILKTPDIFYIPSGYEVGICNYIGKKKRTYTRGKKRVCQIYLPSTLFSSIKRVKDKITKYPTYKNVENQHILKYKQYQFTFVSNLKQVNHDKNKEFLKDLKRLSGRDSWSDPIVTKKLKNDILDNMKNFIEKYENFQVEN